MDTDGGRSTEAHTHTHARARARAHTHTHTLTLTPVLIYDMWGKACFRYSWLPSKMILFWSAFSPYSALILCLNTCNTAAVASPQERDLLFFERQIHYISLCFSGKSLSSRGVAHPPRGQPPRPARQKA